METARGENNAGGEDAKAASKLKQLQMLSTARATFKESDGGQVHKMVTEIENLSQENKKLALKMKEKDAKLESQEGE